MSASTTEVSRTKAWVMAARPQTLPAAAAPVIVGTGIAVHDGVFAALPALFALVGAGLIQVATNFANDYYDAVQGADTEAREGFTRVTASGLISASEVKRAMYLTFLFSVLVGTYLVYVGGVPILVIGLLSVASGIAYTGGPYPLGYHGLGDVFVFIFFGLVAVTGTYYVQAAALLSGVFPLGITPGTVTTSVVLASLPIAAISTNILVVNNLRDRREDAQTGKRTLVVRFGPTFARIQFVGLFVLAYAVPFVLLSRSGFDLLTLLPLGSFPLALMVTRTVLTESSGAALNPALEQTGKTLALYAVLAGIGFAL